MALQLLIEKSESRIETLTENTAAGNVMYLEGPFIMTNALNRNKRMYTKGVMEESVERYINDYVNERRAIGELNHPEYPFADPAKAALKVESLEWRGDLVYGKARVLNNPYGDQIKSLLEADFNLGVSTRGLGSADAAGRVAAGYLLNAIDAVDRPSGQVCYVNQVLESVQWELNESSGVWMPVKLEETFKHAITEIDSKVALHRLEKLFASLASR
jgi:hypothetical protein